MRIISGEYGGRSLKAVKGDNTRPTTDKIKEALFHMIGPYFDGGYALDLYAGSGSLGIEAVSRGMKKSYLIDNYPLAIKTIKENIAVTKEEDKFVVWKSEDKKALEKLKNNNIKFDLVFLDPPYTKNNLASIMERIIQYELLNDKALIVCETDKKAKVEVGSEQVTLLKEKKYGATKLHVYEWRYQHD